MAWTLPLPPGNALLLAAAVTAMYQLLFYVAGRVLRTSKLVDFAGATNFLTLAVASFLLGARSSRKALLTIYVTVWSARLAVFLLMRIVQWGHDRRFQKLEAKRGHIAIFWTLQAIWVWTVSLPITLANTAAAGPPLGGTDAVLAVVFTAAVLLEAVADLCKLAFKPSANGAPWIRTGVWRFSRHPNYFAEIVIWFTLAFAAVLDVSTGLRWLCFCSPLFITCLILFVSGVPILELSADRKYGSRDDYITYKKSTSLLIPFPPSWYSRLPAAVKKSVFLDFDMFNHIDEKEPLVTSEQSGTM